MKRYDMNIVAGEVNASEAEDGEWVLFADHEQYATIKESNLKLLRDCVDKMTKDISDLSDRSRKDFETIGNLHKKIRELRTENDGYQAEIADMRVRTGYGSMEEKLKQALAERDGAQMAALNCRRDRDEARQELSAAIRQRQAVEKSLGEVRDELKTAKLAYEQESDAHSNTRKREAANFDQMKWQMEEQAAVIKENGDTIQQLRDGDKAMRTTIAQKDSQLVKYGAALRQIADMAAHHAGQTVNERHMQMAAREALGRRTLGSHVHGHDVETQPGPRFPVPEGQTPLDDSLRHRYLDVIKEGIAARDSGAHSPYSGQSLEHCLHGTGWVQRDLRLALDKALNEREVLNRRLLELEKTVDDLKDDRSDLRVDLNKVRAEVKDRDAKIVGLEKRLSESVEECSALKDQRARNWEGVTRVVENIDEPIAVEVHGTQAHPDDRAVDDFGARMKAKLAQCRRDGKNGWWNGCTTEHLAYLLMTEVFKGNGGTYVDIANYAMMLSLRNAQSDLLADLLHDRVRQLALDCQANMVQPPCAGMTSNMEDAKKHIERALGFLRRNADEVNLVHVALAVSAALTAFDHKG